MAATQEALSTIFLDPFGIEEERGIWEFTRRVGYAGPSRPDTGTGIRVKNREVDVGDKISWSAADLAWRRLRRTQD